MSPRRTVNALASFAVLWAGALAVNRSLRRVEGGSMLPTLAPGDRLLVRPVGPLPPRRGDVVVVRDPRRPRRATVKRVVGLPGDRMELRSGRLSIDGVTHIEPYAHARSGDDSCAVPPAHLYVLGDNRAGSTDSRTYGPVPMGHVMAVVLGSVRPLRASVRSAPLPLTGQPATATTSSSGSSRATPDPA